MVKLQSCKLGRKEKRYKLTILKIKKEVIATDLIDIKRIIKQQRTLCLQFYNLDVIDQFLERHKLSKHRKKKNKPDILNSLILSKSLINN